MATEATESAARRTGNDVSNRFRTVIADVVGFLRGVEVARAYSSISLEELIDMHIDRIEMSASGVRPGKLAQLESIKVEFDNQIAAIRETDPNSFMIPDADEDANSDPDADEET